MSQELKKENEVKLGIVETSEDFIHLGVDATLVNVVVSGNLDLDKRDPKEIDAWLEKTKTLKDIKPEEKAKMLEEGLAISSGMIADSNMLLNLTGKTIAEKAIIIGNVCNRLQNLKKGLKNGDPWGIWADKYITYLTSNIF